MLKAKVLGIELDIPFLKTLSLEARSVHGQTYLLTKMDGMLFGICSRVSASPIDPIWKTRIGHWTKKDKAGSSMFADLELALDSKTGLLVARIAYGGSASYPLRIINDHELVTEGRGRNLGATLFIERGTDGKEVLDFFGIKMVKS